MEVDRCIIFQCDIESIGCMEDENSMSNSKLHKGDTISFNDDDNDRDKMNLGSNSSKDEAFKDSHTDANDFQCLRKGNGWWQSIHCVEKGKKYVVDFNKAIGIHDNLKRKLG